MFDTTLRQFKDRVGTPMASRMSRVSPMVISVLSPIVGLLAAYSAFKGQYTWSFALWYLNRALDGLVARLTNNQPDHGGYIDILIDFIVYAALPIGLVAGSASSDRYLALTIMLAPFYVNSAS